MTKQKQYTLMLAMGLALSSVFAAENAKAQAAGDDIESLFDQQEKAAEPAQSPTQEPAPESKPAPQDIKDITDLQKLSEFKDIAVIEKRFLPKTGRFELFGGGMLTLNDVFFMNFGLNGRFGYYFQERYGIEFVGMTMTTSERQVITDLRERGIETKQFVSPKSYLGLDFKWSPIYGKMTWFNKTITPFDLYFSLGGGTTGTNAGTSEPTVHLGTGQVFALTKAMAFRWDFSWNFYSWKAPSTGATSVYNNLFITFGLSFFFPEATYR